MAPDDKTERAERESDYRDKDAPQWMPGDANGDQRKPGRRQKSNKAPFENADQEK